MQLKAQSYFENKKAKKMKQANKQKETLILKSAKNIQFCTFFAIFTLRRNGQDWLVLRVNFNGSKLRKLTQIKWKIRSLSCATLNGMIVRWERNSFTDSLSL